VIIGVDLGNHGGISVVDPATSELIEAFDMPLLRDGPEGRPTINAVLLSELVAGSRATKCYCEFVSARPREGSVQSFSFGRARGLLEGVCAALNIPVVFIAPPSWKRAVGIPPGRDGAKDKARSIAIAKWPAKAALFSKKINAGRAEAALVAVAGLLRERRP
jgi:crossover junction endodeoxyribonuclease RuvC